MTAVIRSLSQEFEVDIEAVSQVFKQVYLNLAILKSIFILIVPAAQYLDEKPTRPWDFYRLQVMVKLVRSQYQMTSFSNYWSTHPNRNSRQMLLLPGQKCPHLQSISCCSQHSCILASKPLLVSLHKRSEQQQDCRACRL